jgi:hypothetical protein
MPQKLENNNQILYETRSGEVQELIGKMPNWLLRYGIFIVGLLLVLIFVAAAYIKYPDKVLIPILIEQSKPPISVFSKTSGVIKDVYIHENDSVLINQPICMLMTLEDKVEIDILDNLLKEKLSNNSLQYATYPALKNLGALQLKYFELQNKVKLYKNYLHNNGDQIKLNEIENQWKASMNAIQAKTKVGKIKAQTNNIEYAQYLEDKKLFEQNAITQQEYLESKKRYLNTQVATTADQTEVNNAQQELAQLSLNKMSLLNEKEKQLFTMQLDINTLALSITQGIQEWRNQFIILATGSGRAFLNNNFKPCSNINPSTELMKLIDGTQDMMMKGYLPLNSIGEVKTDQKVWIDIISFPANKFGYLEARVTKIADYPIDSVYSMQLKLINGFKTSTGEVLPNKLILQGSGSIITKDISVLERLFDKLKFKTNG